MSELDQLWIDGQPQRGFECLEFERGRVRDFDADRFGDFELLRCMAEDLLLAVELEHVSEWGAVVEVQCSLGGRRFVCSSARVEHPTGDHFQGSRPHSDGFFDAEAYVGRFLEHRSAPSVVETPRLHAAGTATIAIDGLVAQDRLGPAELQVVGETRTLLNLKLGSNQTLLPWLSQLLQSRPGRRLTLHVGSLVVRLDQPRQDTARLIAAREMPLALPELERAGLELEFEFESLPVVVVPLDQALELQPYPPVDRAEIERERARLDPEDFVDFVEDLRGPFIEPEVDATRPEGLDSLLERNAKSIRLNGVGRLPEMTWPERVVRHWHRHPLFEELAACLERGEDPLDVWAVLADYLQAEGDPRGLALAATLADDPKAPELVQASLGGLEACLYAASSGGRYRVPGREWAPRVRARWRGPFVIELSVDPDWAELDADEESWGLVTDDRHLSALDPSEVPGFHDRVLPESSWTSPPGFSAAAELMFMLELPCCALLSHKRVSLDES